MEKIINLKRDGTAQEVSNLPKFKEEYIRDDYSMYRERCLLYDEEHPLRIERLKYELVILEKVQIDSTWDTCSSYTRWSESEVELLKTLTHKPHIAWAIDNSFDGLYIAKRDDPSVLATTFILGAYLKEELATFWRLKY